MTSRGLGSGGATAMTSLQEVVEPSMLRIHFRPPNRIQHHRGGVHRPMGAPSGSHEPVVMIRRHQHQLASAMPGDLHRLPLRLVLELAEFVLKLHGGGLDHSILDRVGTEYLYSLHYADMKRAFSGSR